MPSLRNLCNIGLYDVSYKQLCYIDAAEANRLVTAETHERFCVSCGRAAGAGPCLVAQNHTIAVRELPEAERKDDSNVRGRNESDCALTMKDALHNLGITSFFVGQARDETQTWRHKGAVRIARNRINNWGAASINNKAVTIVPADTFNGEQLRQVAKRKVTEIGAAR